jgi:hypothetical protein
MDQAMMMTDGSDDRRLARDMIDVHGREAATVARGNARAAALAGQAPQAKSWIKVLGRSSGSWPTNASPRTVLPMTRHRALRMIASGAAEGLRPQSNSE